MSTAEFQPGSIVRARGREWVVLPQSVDDILHLRPIGGGDDMPTRICVALERLPIEHATFPSPTIEHAGTQAAGLLLRDALMLKLRNGAGPFRSFGNIAIEPRAYQLVPLMMAMKLETVRLLIADDVGIGKTIEAGLIARELVDRGEVDRLAVLCPPHLCEQWREELKNRFHIDAAIVRTNTAARLERGLPAGSSIFTEYPFTIVSLDYIKNKNRRDAFAEQCPEMVIVDEAHTCSRTGQGRQLRFELLRDLARDEERHLVLLTATPHSGDEEAFYNLLSLLKPDFTELKDVTSAEHPLRQKLANHFVQRRRQDIKEWQEGKLFPERFTAETTYKLSGAWGRLFEEVLEYARELVEREEEGSLRQRMNWWAALALLRCISSSPQAAIRALHTRLDNALNSDQSTTESDALEDLEARGAVSVLDGSEDAGLSSDDVEPGAALAEDVGRLAAMIDSATALKSSGDPKLKKLKKMLADMLEEGYQTVVFCRYIATAEYLGDELSRQFKDYEVAVVTGELTPTEREERIESLKESGKPPLLIATDCLSEGVNLQEQFTAMVHYDLSWNPTRHEQREGRVDRFGQEADRVKALMLYGEDNPIDGAVLQVILKKAERIRKELGVCVPMPEDENRITQAIMNTVLLHKGSGPQYQDDMFGFGSLEELDVDLNTKWESAREKAKQHRTIFAQNRLKPEQVMPEWEKAFAVLGTEDDVQRFVVRACERLGAPLDQLRSGGFRAPLNHLPREVKERIEVSGLMNLKKLDFNYPTVRGAEFIHRTHPLVGHLADFIAEQAMSGEDTDLVARAGAVYTQGVSNKTTVYLLRLRSRLTIRRSRQSREMLAEEALALAVEGNSSPRILPKAEALQLMQASVSKNMPEDRRSREIETALDGLAGLQSAFATLAETRSRELLADHRRIREAADARGEYHVKPQMPLDVMGVYVLVPDTALF
ncbi:MAG: DEAD/DEAH box helicase [Candidatus Thiodiazotropha endolucinida]|nr:DEAD/DEAH box helicase [Candidatus Thiodiazotropha taylori]MCG7953168.1 DEAD/DEAH box helicase [Candidatus Thiodiazotropha taylori]MCG8095451.1 DEAD/DEAH box helicase [Candidatus Thiodiazotropha endolucinida]MCW4268594.1 DEAD/DEAH box helicase [Candidatus Thiodiazotropha endolucinida]MCW4273229.1 DEAD/DEAH box helicase [Candidatus Thiodiazotropha endolucinida]